MNNDANDDAQPSKKQFNVGYFEGIYQALDQSIQLDAMQSPYYWERGMSRYNSENYELAIEDFTKVIELSINPEQIADAYSQRSHAHEVLGQFDKVIEDLTWLINHHCAFVSTFSWRGQLRRKLGHLEAAIEDFTAVYERAHRNNDEALLSRAITYYMLEQYSKAVDDLSIVIKQDLINPNFHNWPYYEWRGKAYYMQAKSAEALQDFNHVMELRGQPLASDPMAYIRLFNVELDPENLFK